MTSPQRLTRVRERTSAKGVTTVLLPHRWKETKGEAKGGAASGRAVATAKDTICHSEIKQLRRHKKLISPVSLNLNGNNGAV